MYEMHGRNTEYLQCDAAAMCGGSCTGILSRGCFLGAGPCAKKELSPLQIHSLGMVVIPPIHSNLIWQNVLCMTEPWTPIGGGGGGWGGGEWRTGPEKLNEWGGGGGGGRGGGGGFPGLIQNTWLINGILHLEMTLYAARVKPNGFRLQCTVDMRGGGALSEKAVGSNPAADAPLCVSLASSTTKR